MTIKGTLHLYSETGNESGWWAIQDENHIHIDESGEHWSYEGLHFLNDGDYFKIFDPEGEVYWEGILSFLPSNSLWAHSDRIGITRGFWASPFFRGYKAEVAKAEQSGKLKESL